MGITQCPPDVLLELAKLLDVADLLRFIWFHKTFWLTTIAYIREVEEMQPLPLPPAVSELENIVRNAVRLMKNLKRRNPRPVRIRTLAVDPGVLLCVPGANLIVIHHHQWVEEQRITHVSCWDILTARCVGRLDIPELRIDTNALCMEIHGKALIGATIG
ncbi:hypothetical protein K438DRAFT_1965488 [Mycena galopus ATCC 62051]|nr:hypothetical protein K438DRAFT_1965488 [Mycena galopus ATCC 62051]